MSALVASTKRFCAIGVMFGKKKCLLGGSSIYRVCFMDERCLFYFLCSV